MSFLNKISSLFGGSFLDKAGDLVDRFVTTKEERFQLKQALEHMHQSHLEKLHALANEDRNSARKMQIAALGQGDLFSKRFVYYLAAFWSVAGVAYVFLVTFGTVVHPRMADTVMGFLMGTIVSTIINYFYGSSDIKTPNPEDTIEATAQSMALLQRKKKKPSNS